MFNSYVYYIVKRTILCTIMYASLSSFIVLFTLKEEDYSELLPSLLMGYVAHFLKWISEFYRHLILRYGYCYYVLGTVEWTGQGTFGLLRNSR